MKHPLHQNKDYPTHVVLLDLAAQGDCDCVPNDQMREAAMELVQLNEKIVELSAEVDRCKKAFKLKSEGTRKFLPCSGHMGKVDSIKDGCPWCKVERLGAAMNEFCDRVETGEIRSTHTYNRFKRLLER